MSITGAIPLGADEDVALPVVYYTDLITSLHRVQPKYMAMVSATVQPFVDIMAFMRTLPTRMWLDNAAGNVLDEIGAIVGVDRMISIPISYFTFDDTTKGFDTYHFVPKNPQREVNIAVYDPASVVSASALSDDDYRMVVKLGILIRHWDGTVEGLYTSFDNLFKDDGYSLRVTDNEDNTMAIELRFPSTFLVSDAFLSTFTNGLHTMKPAGITLPSITVTRT